MRPQKNKSLSLKDLRAMNQEMINTLETVIQLLDPTSLSHFRQSIKNLIKKAKGDES